MDLDYLWVVSTQENLKNMYFEMKLRLARYYLDQKEYIQAIAHLRQLITLRPFSEEILTLLISALAKIGDFKGVKEQYHTYTKSIFEELGLMPSPEITALYKRLSQN
jgi:two-component SAPR family response regulator